MFIYKILQSPRRNKLCSCRNICQWVVHKKITEELYMFKKSLIPGSAGKLNKAAYILKRNLTQISTDGSRHNEEIKRILDIPKSKLLQLGYVNAAEFSKALKALDSHRQFLTNASDVKILFDLMLHVIERYNQTSRHALEKFIKFICYIDCISDEQVKLFLHMCLESHKKILISDFLNILEKNNLALTQEIAELMIENLAQFGDIEGITVLLSLMKKQALILSEHIFCSLLLVNSINGNQKNIDEVLNTVQSSKGNLSTSVESRILISHIYRKELDIVRTYIDKWKDRPMSEKLTPEQFSDIIIHFVKSGSFKNYKKNLDYILKSNEIVIGDIDLRKVVLILIHHNYPEEAIFILCRLHNLNKNSRFYSSNSIFIRELVKAKYDSNLIIELCDDLKKEGISNYAFLIALEAALTDHRMELSWTLLRAFKIRNESIREHYFWPLLAMELPNDDRAAKVLRGLSGMLELGVNPGSETLRDYVIPWLPVNDVKVTLQMLSNAGISESTSVTPLLSVLLSNHLMKEANELVRLSLVPFAKKHLLKHLAESYICKPVETLELFNVLLSKSNPEEVSDDYGGQFFVDLITNPVVGQDILKIMEVCKFLKEANIKISREYLEDIVNIVESSLKIDVRKSLEPIVDKSLDGTNIGSVKYFIPPPKEMDIYELEGHLTELKAKKMNTRGVLRKLLILHSSQKNIERSKEIAKEIFETDELKGSLGMQSSIMQTKLLEKDVEGAVECYYLLSQENSSFIVDSYKVVDLCDLLVANHKTEVALQILKEYISRTPKTHHNKKAIQRNCHKLLVLLSETKDYSMTKEFVSLLLSGGLAEPSPIILGPLIKAKLLRNDVVGAVTEADEIYSTYKVLPLRIEILIELIKCLTAAKERYSKNSGEGSETPQLFANLVDKMIGLCTTARGSRQAREDILNATIEVGILEEAFRIFKFVEKDLNTERIRQLCNNYVRKEKTQNLVMLLKISKNSSRIDRLYICQCLLNIYTITRSGSEALNLWGLMQEENVTPSDAFMDKLANVLKSTNTHSPFDT